MDIFEVFDGLQTSEDVKSEFAGVDVEKIQLVKNTGEMAVYIQSSRILNRRLIKELSLALSRQFSEGERPVTIKETYKLSSQYTLTNLWNFYKENIIEEIVEKSGFTKAILERAEVSIVEDGTIYEHTNVPEICFETEDDFINRRAFEAISSDIKKIIKSRFNLEINIKTTFNKKSEIKMADDKKLYEEKISHNIANMKQEKSAETNDAKTAGTEGKQNVQKDIQKTEQKTEQKTVSKKTFDNQKSNADSTKFYKKKLADDPEIFYGRPFEGEEIPIADIQDEIGEVVIKGKIIKSEDREIREGLKLVTVAVTDLSDTINVKFFFRGEQAAECMPNLKTGKCVRLKGLAVMDKYDKEIGIGSVIGIKNIPDFFSKRKDDSELKRIELHAHTMMSDMDAVVDPQVLVKTAFNWGHEAIAITDHGVVQAFTEANHALNPKAMPDEAEAKRAKNFKIIFGTEAYLVDDVQEIVKNDKGQKIKDTCVVFDIETTGFDARCNKITEIGAVKVSNGEIVDRYSTFINPREPIPPRIEKLTGISDDMVADARGIEEVLPEFLEFCADAYVVAHNASFDTGFIKQKAKELGISTDFTIVDTVGLARVLLHDIKNYKLNNVADALGVVLAGHHRAVNDAEATAGIYLKFIDMLENEKITMLSEVNSFGKVTPEAIKKMPTYHCILLCKNDVGRINLYKLISLSHLDYFSRRPRIPKSILEENREGIIIGSACEAGELFRAVIDEQPADEIARLCHFYDYFEIQPIGNNSFLKDEEKYPDIRTDEDLRNLNREIVRLGEQFNKPVVATCDVHFLNPEDEVYRRIIMASKGFEDADRQPPLYFRTTKEMLDEFEYLGSEKAKEVVITNTNLINNMIEKISPVRPDKCPPVIENSDETLKTICYNKAHSMYGDVLPDIVSKRLEKELHSIITNGFAVMYIIAQKLVWKSNEDGYLVGSRGSVGSSFVATMAGITEVNPLPAHYYCTNCFFSDFDSESVKKAQKDGLSGCDMPDRICPKCGAKLNKDGHDIPFETFLGFNGDKEPDIDLNFSGEYQSKAHDYTEVIFGKGQTFRAGTIGTLADKTAYGYVLKYDEERGITKRKAEIERIAAGCVGVRRTTGQHPGGIIVLPFGQQIYSFTPVQHPANDMTTKTVTTHFDYHSIDHNLLKLDILGHDDPTMIRRLEDLTGLDAKTIPMDDQKVISLFYSTEALGITPDDIGGCDLGSLGLPELGTDFVMQMLRDTKPRSFSDMIRISGLSHGTDVWLNNTQTLIQEGKCTLSTAICTRDDIMTYLIYQGVESGHAFKIMESVRKGKGLTPEMEAEMLENGVPDWYIWSCKRIKYMFPKAHACAYVMMAFRIAYFKIYYPLAYYAAYFGIRATAFNYELMCLGKDVLEKNMKQIKDAINKKTAAAKDEDVYKDMKIVQEMYARGFEFLPIDLYKVKAHEFQIIDGKLMPALDCIEGLGEKAADMVVEAAKESRFLSREDLKTRGKVSQTTVDKMAALGLLGDIPISNQMSLEDFFTM